MHGSSSNVHTVVPRARMHDDAVVSRGIVVPEHGGAPFRQIFLNRNGAPANIVYHRRNTDTVLQRSSKSAQAAALSIMTYLNVSP